MLRGGGGVRRAGGSGTREKGCVCPAPGAEERCRWRAYSRRRARLPGGVAAGRGCPRPPARLGEVAPGGLRAGLRGAGSAVAVGGGGVEGSAAECRGAEVLSSLLGAAPAVSCGAARLSPPGAERQLRQDPAAPPASRPPSLTLSLVGAPGAGRGSPRLRAGVVRLRGEAGRDPPARPQALCNRRGCRGGSPRSGPTWLRPPGWGSAPRAEGREPRGGQPSAPWRAVGRRQPPRRAKGELRAPPAAGRKDRRRPAGRRCGTGAAWRRGAAAVPSGAAEGGLFTCCLNLA